MKIKIHEKKYMKIEIHEFFFTLILKNNIMSFKERNDL